MYVCIDDEWADWQTYNICFGMMMIMIMIVMITMKTDNDEEHVDDVDEECHDVWYVIMYDDGQDDEHDNLFN